MSAPLIPSPLDSLRGRRFAVVPPMPALGPNDWVLGVRSWGDVQIVNVQTGTEIWISRHCVQGVCDGSEYGAPVIALAQPLGCRDGLVFRTPSQVVPIPQGPDRSRSKRLVRVRSEQDRGHVVPICPEGPSAETHRLRGAMWAAVAACLVPAIVFALLLS